MALVEPVAEAATRQVAEAAFDEVADRGAGGLAATGKPSAHRSRIGGRALQCAAWPTVWRRSVDRPNGQAAESRIDAAPPRPPARTACPRLTKKTPDPLFCAKWPRIVAELPGAICDTARGVRLRSLFDKPNSNADFCTTKS